MISPRPDENPRRIVLAVTTAQSLTLMKDFPEFLGSRGWEVHVVTSGANSEKVADGVTLHDLPMMREPSPLADLVALVRWIWLLLRVRPMTVVAGTPKAGLLGTLAARLIGVPSRVYMLRGLRLETETGLRRRLLLGLEWIAGRASTKVLAVSHSLLEEFVGLRLCSRDKVVVLGAGSSNGVVIPKEAEKERLAERTRQLRTELCLQSRPTVGFVGRLSRDKGLPILLEAVDRLRVTGGEVQLLVVGQEEPTGFLREALRSTTLRPETLVWTGPVDDVQPYYGLMDVLCLPTKREGFPNVVLEAAANGVPSVVSRVTGASDSVVDGVTGVLYEQDDPRQLADALKELVDSQAAREAMGRKARNRVIELFERSRVWHQTASFLEDELARTQEVKAGR